MSDFVMPWGKYKGRKIEKIPSSYVKWLAESCEDEDICYTADEEYRRRTDEYDHWEEN